MYSSTVTLKGVWFSGNTAGTGGDVLVGSGLLTFSGCSEGTMGADDSNADVGNDIDNPGTINGEQKSYSCTYCER